MITRIEIDGFKGFENFSMEFRPFTVIAGVNGVGKSNLFDAMRHLSYLVSKTLRESFETDRGSLFDLFTIYPNGTRKNRISYVVEMLLPEYIEDEFSEIEKLKYLRLRYELAVSVDNEGKFQIEKERLTPIKRGDDAFLKIHRGIKKELPTLTGGRSSPFIGTDEDSNSITISQDGIGGNKRTVSLKGAQRTVLSSITTVEFPHAYAAKSMLQNIHFLQLNPEQLRKSSKVAASPFLEPDGSNLATMVARLRDEESDIEQMISNDLSSIVPGVGRFILHKDESKDEYVIFIEHIDGYEVPSKLLSDGTLRILALIAISYDSQFNGTIILEEPENGVHPGRLARIVELLQDMTNLPSTSSSAKQIITNTHSSSLIEIVDEDFLAMAQPKTVVSQTLGNYTVTTINYVNGELLSSDANLLARYEAKALLDSDGKRLDRKRETQAV